MLGRMSVRKPFTVLVGVILILILGGVAFVNTSTDLMPNMNLPFALVMTTNPGAAPEEMETAVTQPIERRMATITGIDNITSVSSEHMSMVILEFVGAVNMDTAVLEMREGLDMLTFPEGAGRPMIMKLNPDMLPIMVAAVDADERDLHEISALVENEIAPALEGVAGVASASLSGLLERQLHVVLYQERIDAVNQRIHDAVAAMMPGMPVPPGGEMPDIPSDMSPDLPPNLPIPELDELELPAEMLTVEAVRGMLFAQDFSMPAGTLTEDGTEYMVRVGDRFDNIEEIETLLIADMPIPGLDPITLSDIADIFETDNSGAIYTRVNSNPAVMITMQRQTEFATSDVSRGLRDRMAALEETHEEIGLSITPLMDQGEYIDIIVDSVLQNLIIGGLLAILILLLFLRDFRPTLVVGISIPLSIMLAFTAMYFTGVTLNVISMSGLALGVGLLIDNSIVAIDNIYRLRNEGVPARRAAVEGVKQIAGAITTTTLTTIAVFLPILFTHGMTRQIFSDLGLTIAYSLLASLLIALTVVPAACSGTFKRMQPKEHRLWNRFLDGYAVLLRGALRVKWLTLLLAAVLLGGSVWGVIRGGTEFMPPMDAAEISASVTMPEGSVFEDSVAMAEELQERLADIEDIETIGVTIGGNMMGAAMGMNFGGMGGGTNIDMYILMADDRTLSNEDLTQKIRDRTEDLDADITVTGAGGDMAMMMGAGISLRIEGRDLDTLRDISRDIAEIVREVPGAAEVSDGFEQSAPELRVRVDKDSAMRYGLTVAQVMQAVAAALTAPEGTIEMTLGHRDYEVVVSDGDWTMPTRQELENLTLAGPAGQTVTLSDIAEVEENIGLTTINRSNQNRTITVTGEIEAGYNVGLVTTAVNEAIRDYELPEGYRIVTGGQREMIDEAFGDLYLMAILAFAFIYLIMVAQFQSLLSPFIIMFTIPLALTGGFLALIIAGMPLSVVAMVGLILLATIVVNNGIVFVDYVNQLRRKGMEKTEAVVTAGRVRLRPILMTGLTTIAAMSVLSVGMGMGSELVQPMAVAAIGGLIYATFTTMLVVPVLYDMLHRKGKTLVSRDDLDEG